MIAEARVDAASDTLYRGMRDMGVIGLSHGVESLKPEIVKWYHSSPTIHM